MINIFILLGLIVFTRDFVYAAEIVKVGNLTLTSAWSRASTGITRPSAVYLSIQNISSKNDSLISVNTPNAREAEIHQHYIDKGIMKMRQVESIEIPASKMTTLKPGGFHIMLFDLNTLLKEKDMFPLSLTFEEAGKATIMVRVAKVGARKADKNNVLNSQNMKSKSQKEHNDIHFKHGSKPAN